MRYTTWPARFLAGLGLVLGTLSGCQTWVPATGQTLPSPRYLEHPPQFFAPSPAFPLSRELASQERAAAAVPDLRDPADIPVNRVPAGAGMVPGGVDPAPMPMPLPPP